MMTIDEVIDTLQHLRARIGRDAPIRVTVRQGRVTMHHDIHVIEALEYDEDVEIILLRGGAVAATEH